MKIPDILTIFWLLFLFSQDNVCALLTHKDWLTLRTERAHILSKYKHLVTSSTLSWAWIEDILSGQIPTSRLILVGGSSAVCRVRDGNRERAGRTDLSGSCLAGPGFNKHSEYQVLVDLTQFSRHEWSYWDMSSDPKVGTVAYNDRTYVGSFQLETGDNIIGELDTQRGLYGNIKAYIAENETKHSTQGSVLVEIEPATYIIDDIKLDESKEKVKSALISLGELWITRELDEPKDALYVSEDVLTAEPRHDWDYLGARIDYSVPVSQDWGHVPGTVRGVETESRLLNTTVRFPWGTHWSGDVHGGVDVGTELQPGTKILAKVQGVLKSGETPYTAVITQVYPDGVKKSVSVEGVLTHTTLSQTRVRYIDRQYIDTGLPAKARPPTPVRTTTSAVMSSPSSDKVVQQDQEDEVLVPLGTPMSMISSNSSQESQQGTASTPLPATLYPPTVPTSAKPNPLRKFYPVEDDPPKDVVMFSAAKYEHPANKAVRSDIKSYFIIAGVFLLSLFRLN